MSKTRLPISVLERVLQLAKENQSNGYESDLCITITNDNITITQDDVNSSQVKELLSGRS